MPFPTPPTPCANAQHTSATADVAQTNTDGIRRREDKEKNENESPAQLGPASAGPGLKAGPEHHYTFVADEDLRSWKADEDSAVIIPILSRPSRRQLKHNWSLGMLCPVPTSTNMAVFMDPAQNLIAVVYAIPSGPHQSDETVRLNPRALNSDSVHPQILERAN
ncbi:uncharacterized protein F5147DRAFT_837351 [Suillus discolor]|uniref:Uncharacterized protein n=1 Tax=Suillus discolor TaxID=1912936 RepID=A0A9P7F5L1_9AGAM|nr:uncharacterized protein F5147DRAFT_837351 [Suillus discolor]KAG2107418.1 hypothetical protein F5147DRAFT_837351 [Suillus discolor]